MVYSSDMVFCDECDKYDVQQSSSLKWVRWTLTTKGPVKQYLIEDINLVKIGILL